MNIDDLTYVFRKQIAVGEKKLYFMLIDGDRKIVERHPYEKMDELIPMLSCFEYAGNDVMPRFSK